MDRIFVARGKTVHIQVVVPDDVIPSGQNVYADIYKQDGTLITSQPIKLDRVGNTDIYRAEYVADLDTGKYDVEIWIGTFDSSKGTRNKTETIKYIGLQVTSADIDDVKSDVDSVRQDVQNIRQDVDKINQKVNNVSRDVDNVKKLLRIYVI